VTKKRFIYIDFTQVLCARAPSEMKNLPIFLAGCDEEGTLWRNMTGV
jgi:hypothetical protein